MTTKPTEKLLLRELHDSQKRIEIAMFGDEKAGIAGVIGTIKKHDKKINNHEKAIWIFSGFIVAVEVIKKYFWNGS